MIRRAWVLAGGASLAVIGVAWSVGFAAGQFRALIADADARGHARGRAEASAEQAAALERLRAEAAAAAEAADRARAAAVEGERELKRDYETRHADALRRAREAAGGDCLRRPVPDGLRLGPDPARFRGQAGAPADSAAAPRGADNDTI